jgi:2',3'-cyclic-nucleotide 2'-phosphodiesterase (5'-nucleotidase family)
VGPCTHPARRAASGFVLVGLIAAAAACGSRDVDLLLTADTEGRIRACESCSTAGGLGELSRRASAVGHLRSSRASSLLVDAGNFLIGPDSLDSGGRVIAAAYSRLGYDAVNLSYRDFRLGKSSTLEVLRAGSFSVVSANVVDDATGRPVAEPFVVKRAGAVRVGFLGLTELPPGVERLEHIATQLAGLRVRPPAEALAEWLPKARAASDVTVLLFHGSAEGLAAVRSKFGGQLSAILVGGLRPADLPDPANPPVVAVGEGGTDVMAIRLPASGRTEVRRVPVDGRFPPDQRMLDLLKAFDGKTSDGGREPPVM